MLPVLQFIFSSFWTWFGTEIFVCTAAWFATASFGVIAGRRRRG